MALSQVALKYQSLRFVIQRSWKITNGFSLIKRQAYRVSECELQWAYQSYHDVRKFCKCQSVNLNLLLNLRNPKFSKERTASYACDIWAWQHNLSALWNNTQWSVTWTTVNCVTLCVCVNFTLERKTFFYKSVSLDKMQSHIMIRQTL